MASVLFAGFGDVGARAGRLLAGAGLHVVALRRNAAATDPDIACHAVDLRAPFTLQPAWALQPDVVVIAVSPSSRTPEDYAATYVGAVQHTLRAVREAGARPRLALFVSSTGVWPENPDAWLSEDTPARADSWSGEILLRAEDALFASGLPAATLRLGGIYGPGRLMLVRKAAAILAGREPWPAPAWTNRVHREDAARMIAFLTGRALAGDALDRVYNGVDNAPSLNVDVLAYIAGLLRGGDALDLAAAAPPANVAVGGKRVGNARLRALGFAFRYPDYRAGYADVLATLTQEERANLVSRS